MTVAAPPETIVIDVEENHTSVFLLRLIDEAPDDAFTLEWLIGHLPRRSYGVILLFLAIIALVPIISIPARMLILILTLQSVMGYPAPVLPRRWMTRSMSSRHLQRLRSHLIPMLGRLESFVRPRWCPMLNHTKLSAAIMVFSLTLLSLLAPIPFANVPPALICIVIALGYIEHDGLLLVAGFVSGLVLLGAVAALLTYPY